ncbi:MAG: DUF3788 family protein [Firmicutes bacterium]|nr:DUF3788 family protein [Bacillota bacterium]
MNVKTELQKVSEETMRFMRGKYVADEISNGKDELKFRRGGKTIVAIYTRDDHFAFLVIFGKAEREVFEQRRSEFPQKIQEIYDESKTYHDGKWMLIPVADLKTLDAVKQLILIKKKPNRKPFSKEQAVYADCGHRCDLCVHYSGGSMTNEFREELKQRLIRVYAGGTGDGAYWGDDMKFCHGCDKGGLDGKHDCHQKKCAAAKGIDKCVNCSEYPCDNATAGWPPRIEAKTVLADDVTWAILPYVDGQYGN